MINHRRILPITPFLLLVSFFMGSTSLADEPSEATALIKERVTQYFAAVQSNDIGKAKEFVLEKSRQSFFLQFDSKLTGVRVAEIHLEKDKTSAVVKVLCQVMNSLQNKPMKNESCRAAQSEVALLHPYLRKKYQHNRKKKATETSVIPEIHETASEFAGCTANSMALSNPSQ